MGSNIRPTMKTIASQTFCATAPPHAATNEQSCQAFIYFFPLLQSLAGTTHRWPCTSLNSEQYYLLYFEPWCSCAVFPLTKHSNRSVGTCQGRTGPEADKVLGTFSSPFPHQAQRTCIPNTKFTRLRAKINPSPFLSISLSHDPSSSR